MILSETNLKKKFQKEIAKLTLECLKNSVPSGRSWDHILSGGQSEIEATENLNLINKNNNIIL